MPPGTAQPRRRRGLWAVGLALSLGLVGSTASPAAAAREPAPPQGSGVLVAAGNYFNTDTVWLGSYTDDGGNPIWCHTLKRYAGTSIGGWGRMSHPQLAYAMWRYSQAGYRSNETHAVISYVIHRDLDGNVNRKKWTLAGMGYGGLEATRAAVEADMNTNYGPYSVAPVVRLDRDAHGRHMSGSVSGVTPKAAGGALVAGIGVTLSLSGPATFSGGAQTMTFTSSTGDQSFPIAVTGNGRITVTSSFTGPNTDIVERQTTDPSLYQHYYLAAEPVAVSGSGFADAARDVDFTVSTSVSERIVKAGEPVFDKVTVGLKSGYSQWPVDQGGSALPVITTCDLYGPYETAQGESATVPANAPKIGSVAVTSTAAGTQQTPPAGTPKATESGYYTWVCNIVKADQSAAVKAWMVGEHHSKFFEFVETSVKQFTPSVKTKLAEAVIEKGTAIVDAVTLAGFPTDHTEFAGGNSFGADAKVVSHTLYWIPGSETPEGEFPHEDACIPDRKVETVETPAVNGETNVTFKPLTLDTSAGGWVTVVSSYAGDDRTTAFTSTCGDPEETAFVAPVPGLRTKAQPNTRIPGEITDTIQVTGFFPKGTVLTSDAYWSEDDPTCTAAFYTADEITYVPGTLEYTTAPVRIDKRQNVWWIEQATWKGKIVARGECAQAEETTVTLWEPEVVSKMARAVIAPGAKISDTVTLSNFPADHATGTKVPLDPVKTGKDPVGDVTAEGLPVPTPNLGYDNPTVEHTLYWVPGDQTPKGEFPHEDACTPQNKVQTVTSPASNGDHTVTFDPLTVDTTGGGWVTVVSAYEGDYRTLPFASVCGEPSESSWVPPAPGLSTKAQRTVEVPGEATDTIITSGFFPEGTELWSEAHWAGTDKDCSKPFYVSQKITYRQGTSEYVTSPAMVAERRNVVWVEHASWQDEIAIRGKCNLPEETTVTPFRPSVTTKLANAVIGDGQAIVDVINLADFPTDHATGKSVPIAPDETYLHRPGKNPAPAPTATPDATGTPQATATGSGASEDPQATPGAGEAGPDPGATTPVPTAPAPAPTTVEGLPVPSGNLGYDNPRVVHELYWIPGTLTPQGELPHKDQCTPEQLIQTIEGTAANGTSKISFDPLAIDTSAGGWVTVVSKYLGDYRTHPFATRCGEPTETAYVPADRVVRTKAQSEVTVPGEATDTIIVEGFLPKGTQLYTQAHYSVDDPQCTQPFYTSKTITYRPDRTEYVSSPAQVTEYQNVFWREAATWQGELITQGVCGVREETTTVLNTRDDVQERHPQPTPTTGVQAYPTTDLPFTGSNPLPLIALGAMVLTLGIGAVLIVRHRRRREA